MHLPVLLSHPLLPVKVFARGKLLFRTGLFFCLFLVGWCTPQAVAKNAMDTVDQILFRAMQDELDRNMQELSLPGVSRPFILQYTIQDGTLQRIQASLGALRLSTRQDLKSMRINLILGDYARNSTLLNSADYTASGIFGAVPVKAGYDELRRLLWWRTDAAYKGSAETWQAKLTALKQQNLPQEELNTPDLIPLLPIEKHIPHVTPTPLNVKTWEENLRILSNTFSTYPQIYYSTAGMELYTATYYTVTSEKVVLQIPMDVAVLSVVVYTKTEDGFAVEDRLTYYGHTAQDFPPLDSLLRDAKRLADEFLDYRQSPKMDENYTGPVLLEGYVAAKYLATPLCSTTGQGLMAYRAPVRRNSNTVIKLSEERLGRKVLPSDITITAVPGLTAYQQIPLWGSYSIDTEGVIPDSTLVLVENGMLKNLISDRVPTLRLSQPTGNRLYIYNPERIASRVSPGVWLMQSSAGLTATALKERLLSAAREEGLTYGYIVRTTEGGRMPVFYKVYVDDGHEEKVRGGVISGIHFQSLKRILGTSREMHVENMLWNEVPTSFIFPQNVLFEEADITKENPRQATLLPIPDNPL